MMGFPYEHLKRTGMHERFQAHANTILQDLGVQTSFAIDACMHQGGRRPVPEDLGVAAYPLCLHHLFGGKLGDRRRKCPLWSGCSSSRLRHLFGVELVAEVENASCQKGRGHACMAACTCPQLMVMFESAGLLFFAHAHAQAALVNADIYKFSR
eukprot:scaffold20169_cov21-Tisochrysis_lutea.AAC.1